MELTHLYQTIMAGSILAIATGMVRAVFYMRDIKEAVVALTVAFEGHQELDNTRFEALSARLEREGI